MEEATSGVPGGQRWSDELLDRMRQVADPVTDPLIDEVIRDGGAEALRRLNRFLQTWNAPITDEVPAGVRDFLAAPLTFPPWVDEAQLARGQELFRQHGIETLLVLFLKSLPQYFANADGDQSFSRADIFDPRMVRRLLLEVAQLLLDVAVLGSLRVEPRKSTGVYALQKLRLHHSIVRAWVLPDPRLPPQKLTPWRPEWGKPINQEDIAGAIVAFTVWDLEGLAKVGLDLPANDRDATRIYWQVIGWLLGMDEVLQPADLTDATELLAAVDHRQFRHSAEGTTLVRQLLAVPQSFLPRFLDGVPVWIMRRLMSPRFVRLLDVPRTGLLTNLVLTALYALLGHRALHRTVDHVGRRFLRGAQTAEGRHGDRGELRMPPEVESRVVRTGSAESPASG